MEFPIDPHARLDFSTEQARASFTTAATEFLDRRDDDMDSKRERLVAMARPAILSNLELGNFYADEGFPTWADDKFHLAYVSLAYLESRT